jgi:hypothetical protein
MRQEGLTMPQTSGADLLNFLDYAAKKGLINANTAAAVKVACRRVLTVDGDLESLDVSTVDLDSLFKRFENLHRTEFTPRSLETYRSRVHMGLSWFLRWSEDPAGWKPISRSPRGSANGEAKQKGGGRAASSVGGDNSSSSTSARVVSEQKGRLVDYPFPLREGLMVRLMLPPDLKRAEVKRLNSYMITLAVDSEDSGE